jgi:hypothetical protein
MTSEAQRNYDAECEQTALLDSIAKEIEKHVLDCIRELSNKEPASIGDIVAYVSAEIDLDGNMMLRMISSGLTNLIRGFGYPDKMPQVKVAMWVSREAKIEAYFVPFHD